ncbi:MAG: APC family permease [Propionibacteriaceae bacterium]|nr:APC family permease [Propionibacteriaceae bacterium]
MDSTAAQAPTENVSEKGLSIGRIGLLGAIVLGVSCVAPAYTLSGAMGPIAGEAGYQVPAIFLVGFIPMVLVAIGYRELNRAMPDSGTTFTWGTRAFGPWLGWLGGWGLLVSTVLVLSNMAGIAVDFFYLLLSQLAGNPTIAELTRNVPVNIATCLVFIAVAGYIAYRGLDATMRLQYVLVGFQVVVLVLFSGIALYHVSRGTAFDAQTPTLAWFNPLEVPSISAFTAAVSLSVFIFWGWDVVLTLNEETKGSAVTPGRAATGTIVAILALYLLLAVSTLAFAGIGDGEFGLTNPDIQENVFAALAAPVMGPLGILVSLAVLASSMASLQSTFASPARTMLAMGHYRALPAQFARTSPRFQTPSFATMMAAAVAGAFYAVMRLISENVLWDTITALGIMVCFYYGLTALATVAYFRQEAFASVSSFLSKFLAPLLGGLLLLGFFVRTWLDSMNPDFGSGSEIGGLGLVFVIGVALLGLGVIVMFISAIRSPEFFRGTTLRRGTSTDSPEDLTKPTAPDAQD